MSKHFIAGCLTFALLPALALAQATANVPAVAAPASAPGTVATLGRPSTLGDVYFSLTASESILNGYQGASGTNSSTNLSGSASFVSNSETHPFTLVYSGGYLFGNTGDTQGSNFQTLGVSQSLSTKNWRFSAADLVAYLPASPVFGVSGVAGVGDIGTLPVSVGNLPSQSILTNYDTRVSNTVSGSADRRLTGSTSVYGFGAYGITRFPDGIGFESDQVTGSGGVNHRLNALNSVGVNYTYNRFTYAKVLPFIGDTSFRSHSVSLEYLHAFSRRMSLTLTGGPEIVEGVNTKIIPRRIDAVASATMFYVGELTHASASYSRSSNSGSGVLQGTLSDNVSVTVQHSFGRTWEAGLIADYGHAYSLVPYQLVGTTNTLNGVPNTGNTTTNSFYGGVQGTRRFGRYISVFGSYNAQTQSVNGQTLAGNVFSGVANIVSFGVTYSPKAYHVNSF